MSGVTLNSVVKRYGDVQVIHGVDLEIADGEFCVFVGPSAAVSLLFCAWLRGWKKRPRAP